LPLLLHVLQAQLSALVSKCKPGADDLEYFLLEAGQLVGLDVTPEQGAKVSSRDSEVTKLAVVVAALLQTQPLVWCNTASMKANSWG
jgi:hypothetical protein